MVVAPPCAIRPPRLQPHLDGNIERFVGVVLSSRFTSSYGDLQIIKELHRQFILLLRLRSVAFLTRSTTSRPQPTTSSRLREERQRRRVVDTVWRLKMKGFVVSFNANVLFAGFFFFWRLTMFFCVFVAIESYKLIYCFDIVLLAYDKVSF